MDSAKREDSADSEKQEDALETAAPKIQWHPAFRSAFQREFRKYRDCLRFEEEFPLTVRSLFMDLLIIETLKPVAMENELGKIFRRYNICEYKGPDDGLTIDDYYKTQGCAAIFKTTGQTVDAIPAEEITVSLIRDAFPRGLMRKLEEEGFTFTERYPGVFYQERPGGAAGCGNLPFPTQIIVTSRLRRETHSGLRILRRPADREDILRFLMEAEDASEPGDVKNISDILTASVSANETVYAGIRRVKDMKYPALRGLMQEDLDENWRQGLKRGRAEGRAEGRMEGRAEGRAEYVFGLISVYRNEFGLDDETITDRIASHFHMTREEAARYVSGDAPPLPPLDGDPD